ncbi:MAG: enoyl-CoA hydratase/isomerase family protein [Proteobacteria bacterium]|nr:enoyl-CoA hydratase/isomerase family protein [Pseudomonadota bacterium]
MSALLLDDHVVTATEGRLGLITLNRPKALNAIDLEMVRRICAIVERWEFDADIDAILLRSAIPRAFCSGGDVRSIGILKDPAERVDLGRDFFGTEFILNRRINRLRKPFISLIGGIAMGGGLGLSVHGSHRVVSEDVRMAMPETMIGYFPDIGATWFLNRCPGHLGRYLALSGAHINAADALYSGLATHQVPSASFEALTQDLAAASHLDAPRADAIIMRHSATFDGGVLAGRMPAIDRIFGDDDLDAVVDALQREAGDEPWIADALATLRRAAPTSLRATWRRMVEGKDQPVETILIDDYRMALRMVARRDFAEGIRAVLVDKDQSPAWQPATLEEVSEADIDKLLLPLSPASRGEPYDLTF